MNFDFSLPIALGQDVVNDETLYLDPASFSTHYHFIGATGSGKTTAMETILYQLFLNGNNKQSFFIVDPLGPFSQRLMRFLANEDFCDDEIRDRVVYYEPANEQYTTVMNPLRYESRANLDYQVARAMDIVLRGFDSQDLDSMPRLRQWLYRSMYALALLGMPISVSKYLLNPRHEEHNQLLRRLPIYERQEWNSLLKDAGNNEIARILESTRNRMSLFSDYVLLERMFSSTENLFDIPRFVEEGKIVIVNLTPGAKKVNEHVASTIGSLIVNEVFNTGLTHFAEHNESANIFLCLDEFQNFLGPDIYYFLPIIRNMGIKLMLAHQSYSQLEKGDIDLRPMITQARSRLMFANDGEDADLIAEEITNLKWNPDEIKRRYESFKQRIVGHEIKITHSGSTGSTANDSWTKQVAENTGRSKPEKWDAVATRHDGSSKAKVEGSGAGSSEQSGWSEQLVPIHEDYYELVREEFKTREEEVHDWRKSVRTQPKGQALVKLVEDPNLYQVQVDYLPPIDYPELDAAVLKLKEENYVNGPFISSERADQNFQKIREEILAGPTLDVGTQALSAPANSGDHENTFDG